MFLGRLGPLSFGVALVARAPAPADDAPGTLQTDPTAAPPEEDLAV